MLAGVMRRQPTDSDIPLGLSLPDFSLKLLSRTLSRTSLSDLKTLDATPPYAKQCYVRLAYSHVMTTLGKWIENPLTNRSPAR